MFAIRYRAMLGAVIGGVVFSIGLPTVGQAATIHPDVRSAAADVTCGYDGYDGSNGQQPLYNHCGHGSVVIEVDHLFWQTTYACMPAGTHEIPQGDSQWRIVGAEYDGHTCNFRYPMPIVGP